MNNFRCAHCGYVSSTSSDMRQHRLSCLPSVISYTPIQFPPVTEFRRRNSDLELNLDLELGGSSVYERSLLSYLNDEDSETSYDENLRIQDAMGGDVKKAVKSINTCAPIIDNSEVKNEKCVICLSSLEESPEIRRSEVCGHEFCSECITKWLSDHVTCPICVKDMSTKGGYKLVNTEPNVNAASAISTAIGSMIGNTRIPIYSLRNTGLSNIGRTSAPLSPLQPQQRDSDDVRNLVYHIDTISTILSNIENQMRDYDDDNE
ncbi:RING finger domain-containing protein [Tetraselmis virus 1]|uniref:RING finger domain-containing protein n=1 Tax=Tetraselmis virus 1 TaxID=2060617 RepID=A0A2P0VN61_9VIRU|nr:RING finger domain-containing protein [Tetraselmis virus 1]AUF82334.1 RING finger domain-containing protein [Tetraselmis virus 1]